MWILLLLVFIFILKQNMLNNPNKETKNISVSCNDETSIDCKMYNHRDIQTKCSALCKKKDQQYIFSGKYMKKKNVHMCECELEGEAFVNTNEHPDILPDVIPDDSRFSNRDYSEQENAKRYNKLIFG